jgi:hypothetical protein
MDDAKSILNEHRNQATDAAIPLFDVWVRDKTELLSDSDPLPEPDTHARDYIVKNVFAMLCKTYAAWLPEFVHEDELKAAEETLSRIALIQREKLESELRNFGFGFKRVVAPQ